jgi:hypothetical protein
MKPSMRRGNHLTGKSSTDETIHEEGKSFDGEII